MSEFTDEFKISVSTCQKLIPANYGIWLTNNCDKSFSCGKECFLYFDNHLETGYTRVYINNKSNTSTFYASHTPPNTICMIMLKSCLKSSSDKVNRIELTFSNILDSTQILPETKTLFFEKVPTLFTNTHTHKGHTFQDLFIMDNDGLLVFAGFNISSYSYTMKRLSTKSSKSSVSSKS